MIGYARKSCISSPPLIKGEFQRVIDISTGRRELRQMNDSTYRSGSGSWNPIAIFRDVITAGASCGIHRCHLLKDVYCSSDLLGFATRSAAWLAF